MKPCSSSVVLSFLLLLGSFLAAPSNAAVFTCNATTTTTCQSIIGYVSVNASTYGNISSLFQVTLSSILSQKNLSSTTTTTTTITNSTVVSAGSTVAVPIPCLCANGTGRSDKIPRYTIQPGDSLYYIAQSKFGGFVNYTEIASANGIPDPDKIEAGATLYIPLPCSCDPVDGQNVRHLAYVVKSGDSVGSIAATYGTTESTLLKLNGILDPKKLQAGQILDVPLGLSDSKNNAGVTVAPWTKLVVSLPLILMSVCFM